MAQPDDGSPCAKEPRSFAKRVVDPVNSITWFLMDALWMCKLAWAAYAFAGLTVVTGVWLLIASWRGRRGVFADLGLNCWIGMNTAWLVTDLNGQPVPLEVAVPLATLGAIFLSVAACYSQDVRRLRTGPVDSGNPSNHSRYGVLTAMCRL